MIVIMDRYPSVMFDGFKAHICILDDENKRCFRSTLISISKSELEHLCKNSPKVLHKWIIEKKWYIGKIIRNPSLQDIAKVLSADQIVRPEYKEKLAEYVISLMEKENV